MRELMTLGIYEVSKVFKKRGKSEYIAVLLPTPTSTTVIILLCRFHAFNLQYLLLSVLLDDGVLVLLLRLFLVLLAVLIRLLLLQSVRGPASLTRNLMHLSCNY
jgi:hypothetical protein